MVTCSEGAEVATQPRVIGYTTVARAAEVASVSARTVQRMAEAGQIPGAVKPARDWLIPLDFVIPRRARGQRGGGRIPPGVVSA